ncbi:MAG TPA: hypothetical protein VNI83_14230 [Vicinamibacterales bacterium]|nr:hypothetical protein [Vicinamibacterales bacterium]
MSRGASGCWTIGDRPDRREARPDAPRPRPTRGVRARASILALAAAALWQPASPTGDRLLRAFPWAPGTKVVVESTVGDVVVAAWDRADVEVRAERRLEPGAEGRPELRAVEQPHAILVDVRQAADRADRRARTTTHVQVPAAAPVTIRLLDGVLRLAGLRGEVAADVRQGRIEAEHIGGIVRLETGFGDVVVRGAELSPNGLLRLRAFNGSVRLGLARAPADARILALSFNGDIRSDIPLALRRSFGPRFGEATLGRGEPVISIDTITGDIEIRVGR